MSMRVPAVPFLGVCTCGHFWAEMANSSLFRMCSWCLLSFTTALFKHGPSLSISYGDQSEVTLNLASSLLIISFRRSFTVKNILSPNQLLHNLQHGTFLPGSLDPRLAALGIADAYEQGITWSMPEAGSPQYTHRGTNSALNSSAEYTLLSWLGWNHNNLLH